MFAFAGRTMTKLYQLYAIVLWVSIIVILHPALCNEINKYSESEAAKFLERANRENAQWANRVIHTDWNWSSNLTDENEQKMSTTGAEYGKFLKGMYQEIIKYPWATYKDPNIKRQFELFSESGKTDLPKDKLKKFDEIVSEMEDIYNGATIREYDKNKTNQRLYLEPDITDIMATSDDAEERKYVWLRWRDVTGTKVKHLYSEYVKLSNEASRLNNYTDTAEYWMSEYDVDDFRGLMERLWNQIKPLYLQIHAYARRKLWERYKQYRNTIIFRRGPIPAHFLSDLYTKSWDRLGEFSLPFPHVEDIDVTSALNSQNYTPKKMYKLAEEFFTSMNLSAMPHSLWENSILERPSDGRDILCEASAWDFCDSKDYRIKQCTSVNLRDFLIAHHEIAHVQYFLQYKDQPYIYREGPIDGFHEAIGNTIILSVSTPKHLQKIGLFPKKRTHSFQGDINYLYRLGLDKIVALPFAYLVDLWRWNVFKGITTEDRYNCDWWELRYNYQGICPPVTRSENEFDPGSKYHILADTPYISHFVSYIMQFQFHQALCEKAGQYDPNNPKSKPLHECDIYQSKNAGNALKEMMKLGTSKPWFDAMELLTGQRVLDATPLLNYFRPLREWLEKENRRTGELIGWETTKTRTNRRWNNSELAETLKLYRYSFLLKTKVYEFLLLMKTVVEENRFSPRTKLCTREGSLKSGSQVRGQVNHKSGRHV